MNNDKMQYRAANERLEQIFGNVPTDCVDVRLGVRVWFAGVAASEMYVLTDYLYYGNSRTRVRFTERNDQLCFTQTQLDAVLQKYGWAMGQPQRRGTTEFVYSFSPANGQHCFRLSSKSAEVSERRHQQRVFSQLALTT